MSVIKRDWLHFERRHMEGLRDQPQNMIGGGEGRTIYFIRGGQHADQWTPEKADVDGFARTGHQFRGWCKYSGDSDAALASR
jgi:hypothetical protein